MVMVQLLLLGRPGLADMATVTIDGAQTYQVIDGFGVNANHRSWNNNELQPVLDALIDQAGMTLFRVIYDKADWETTNDNSDPNVMNWDYYNQVYSAPDFQKMWDMSAYLNQRGITNGLMFNFQGNGPDWMGGSPLTAGYEAEWAEMVASLFIYARNTQHLQFNLVAPDNEEDILVQGVDMTSDQYVTALHDLSQLLDTNGMSDVRFVGPDLGYTSTDWLSAMMNDPTVMAKVAHFGLHSYYDDGGGSTGIYDFLQTSAYPDRTYWMTEFNVPCGSCEGGQGGTDSWDYASSAARYLLWHLYYGASAGLVWEGYDSQYNYYSPGQWSYWGMFGVDDINAVPKTYTPRKIFYTLAQISKYVRPGAQQIDVSGVAGSFQLLAFYQTNSGQFTLTGINSDTSADTLSAVLTNLPPVASLDLYYTDSDTNLCYSATFPVTNGSFAATVPANCVFTLVGYNPASIAVSVLITNPVDGARYSAPVNIPIQASATTTTGNVSQVEFFSGATDLGEAVIPPYSITWSNVPPGAYVLTASATNSVGNFRMSPGVHVTVVGPIAQTSITPSNAAVAPYGTQQFTAAATDALGAVITPPPAFAWSVSGGGTIDSNGLFTAGGNVGGPFAIAASNRGVGGTASVLVAVNLNLAPAGVGYTWYSMAKNTSSSPQAAAPGINDGILFVDVPCTPGGVQDNQNAYEAAGVIWSTPQTINRVVYQNGSYSVDGDGVFAAKFGLQFSLDGTIWANAGLAWANTPAYVCNSPASANTSFVFTGAVVTVRGVRCVGRVHTSQTSQNSWVAFAAELQAFAPPPPPPTVSILITNPVDCAYYTAPATIPIQADAISTTGSISQVEFFSGTTNLGEALAAPYSVTWSNVQPGNYALTASATNSIGDFAVSSVVRVTVIGPTAQISITPANAVLAAYGTQQFTAVATDALGTVIDPPPALAWSVSGGGMIDSDGFFTAGGSAGGPITIAATDNGVTGNASVSISADLNLAPAGLGYTWYSLTAPADNLPQAAAPGLNDGDLSANVPLTPGGVNDAPDAYEAAGVVWSNVQAIDRVIYYNGAFTADQDGVFVDEFGLQFSPDGTTWTNAGPAWSVAPAYTYNSPSSGNASFVFTGDIAIVRGVRCVGRVHTDAVQGSWVASAIELQVFTAPDQPVEPDITFDPTNQTVLVGSTLSFSVAASGTAPLAYQWLLNGTNLGGAVAETLSLTNVQPEQAGGYSVVVTNFAGAVTSVVATLTVWLPPVIAVQPTNQTALVGATVNFSVAASGTAPLTYQWLLNGTNLDGAVAETLSVANVQPEQAGAYAARIWNVGGTTNSAVALLTVLHYPLLLDARTTTDGAFAFTLSGDAGCNYMIEVSTNIVDWTALSTLSNAVGQADFTDSASSNSTSRFYRARLALTQ
jgi:O-glycosyl hydrolase